MVAPELTSWPGANYFSILGLPTPYRIDGAVPAPADVRRAYHAALLKHHPDKQADTAVDTAAAKAHKHAASTPSVPVPTVDQIKTAYQVLSNEASYKAFVRSLLEGGSLSTPGARLDDGIEVLDLSDLKYVADMSSYRHDCRCGDENGYIVSEDELDAAGNLTGEVAGTDIEIVVGCSGCSLQVKVVFRVSDSDSET